MQTIGFLGPAFFLTQLTHIDSPAMAVLCMACSQVYYLKIKKMKLRNLVVILTWIAISPSLLNLKSSCLFFFKSFLLVFLSALFCYLCIRKLNYILAYILLNFLFI